MFWNRYEPKANNEIEDVEQVSGTCKLFVSLLDYGGGGVIGWRENKLFGMLVMF